MLGKDGKPPRAELVEAMPYTQSLLASGLAIGFHAKAAPPTVTMPRLKVGLVTISHPSMRSNIFFLKACLSTIQ